jgi:ribosomal protein L37AE/L43A
MTDAIATRHTTTIARRDELTVDEMVAQIDKIHDCMRRAMREGEDYGVIPGTGSKPTLLKPGAEKLCLMFRLAPDPQSVESWDGAHLTVKSKIILMHIPTQEIWGSGEGSCSTKESKYAYRMAKRICPRCDNETITRSKDGGWFCWRKRGGCGAQFPEGDPTIEGQKIGRIPNPDLPDQYNTVLKMADKRGLVAAVLNVTAASAIFTQDLEDTHDGRGDTGSGAPRRDAAIQEDQRGGESDHPEHVTDEGGRPQADRGSSALPERQHAAIHDYSEDEERQSLIAEATRLGKELKMTAADKRAVMLEHLGASDPDLFTVDIASLHTMVAALKKVEDTKKTRA